MIDATTVRDADGTSAARAAMPRLFSSDFVRKVVVDDGARRSLAPRAIRKGEVEFAMTGGYGYDDGTRRHAVEYRGADGTILWMSVVGRPMEEPATVGRVMVRFTDGTTH